MKVKKVVVSTLQENCYILIEKNKVLVIDPGNGIDEIKEAIGLRKVVGVLVTHNHFDHVASLPYFKDDIIYRYDNLEEGEHTIGPFTFEVIYTPGHSKDSVSYYFKEDNLFFGGDFIFHLGIGRCDFEDGDYKEMLNSINKIKDYPKNMMILPGHGLSTTLGYEIDNSLYFKGVRDERSN